MSDSRKQLKPYSDMTTFAFSCCRWVSRPSFIKFSHRVRAPVCFHRSPISHILYGGHTGKDTYAPAKTTERLRNRNLEHMQCIYIQTDGAVFADSLKSCPDGV